ncbi:MAG: sugar phosphate isomerase/epimerase [Gemmatimonadetes bacterium]|jgi:sugar phosphate isomerase/epimerase|nr:sugar phosphate isomerase/epimerase [Gemmatimonadota bacterium]MBT4609031.1 sugar phosphate isomerase/epimerase [Gemmatimonadota bacterium]MBT5060065.1 sugar phosphate isomerase/epimerase [Gemmatimonadota bacterium]MBT5142070.1 sugar phosphate isomerase/epimerase [Gemmatimonadota bacterium]MBT5588496.1 sugar phosphate isomerase/epimerase [Gemmatimonadota bacterium]
MLKQGLDSFSYYMHWRHAGQSIDTLLDRVAGLGLAALQININGPRLRALTGTTVEHFRHVKVRARELGIALEVASRGTEPSKMSLVLELARQLGAGVVRTTIGRTGSEEVIAGAAADLRHVAEDFEACGIALAVENHEDLTAAQVVDLLQRVDSAAVGAVYDSGNSIPFYQDPVEEARLLAPWVRTTHIKDHILVKDGESTWSVGTALGQGRIPLAEIIDVLRTAPHISRLMTQVTYGYAVRLPVAPRDIPSISLYEPVDRPADDLGIWVPSRDAEHGYLTPSEEQLDTAARHVETSVTFMNDLLAS